MQESIAAYRYAEALSDTVGNDKEELLEIEKGLDFVQRAITQNKDILDFFMAPNILSAKKKETLSKVFKNKIHNNILNLLFVLIDHKRENEIKNVFQSFQRLNDIHLSRIKTKLTLSRDLNFTQDIELENSIKEFILSRNKDFDIQKDKENVIMDFHIKIVPEIMGGIIIRVGDKYFDASVRNSLKNWKNNIIESNIDTSKIWNEQIKED